jgi:hypothetical protein
MISLIFSQSLFPRSRPRELEDWIEYSKTEEGREAFFEYEGFNEDEMDLLCGVRTWLIFERIHH